MNLIIRNVNLIDGTGAAPVPSTSVVVENGVISWIGEGDVSTLNRSHYEEIYGQDLTLMPGTLDCHEHFCGDGGKDGVRIMSQQADDRDVLFERAVANARRALMAGQTSARDVGSPHGISITLARAVAAGSIPGPRITASGQWIQFPTTWPGASMRTVNTAQQMRDTITAQIAQGAGLIKVGATGENEDGTGYGTLGYDIAKPMTSGRFLLLPAQSSCAPGSAQRRGVQQRHRAQPVAEAAPCVLVTAPAAALSPVGGAGRPDGRPPPGTSTPCATVRCPTAG